MVKSKPLSNRQRKIAKKAKPKAARSIRAAAVRKAAVASTPKAGTAARVAVRDEAMDRERDRLDAAIAVGDLSREEADAEFGLVGHVGGADMIAIDERGERRAGSGMRLQSRDGLAALHKSGALTDIQVKAGLAYRLCYEIGEQALGSCLGRVGEGRGARDWSQLSIAKTAEGELSLIRSAADLQRAYAVARLNQMERAVFGLADIDGRVWVAQPDGHELGALRQVAGEGSTINSLCGSSGHARAVTKAALLRALDAIAGVLRITGN